MLGRRVAEELATAPPTSLVAPEVAAECRRADLFVLNLECCISERGRPWSAPANPFFFRAPPVAVETLAHLGADCVTLANNHALDFGGEALADTLEYLDAAGIAHVGAGPNEDAARAPVVLGAAGFRLGVVGVSDHPVAFAAGPSRPGIAFGDLGRGVPDWLIAAVGSVDAGAALVAGHSAHVFHGVQDGVLFDLGDFLDDYAVDARLRNDLGLLWFVELDERGPRRLEAVPLKLGFCLTPSARSSRPSRARMKAQSCSLPQEDQPLERGSPTYRENLLGRCPGPGQAHACGHPVAAGQPEVDGQGNGDQDLEGGAGDRGHQVGEDVGEEAAQLVDPQVDQAQQRHRGAPNEREAAHVLVRGRRHLERVLRVYVDHYTEERPHRHSPWRPLEASKGSALQPERR